MRDGGICRGQQPRICSVLVLPGVSDMRRGFKASER